MELLFNQLYTGIYVIDRSMTPTLIGATSAGSADGEFIYVDKYAKPDYGDIVVVYREANGDNIIKARCCVRRRHGRNKAGSFVY